MLCDPAASTCKWLFHVVLVSALGLVCSSIPALAQTERVLILHTNDIHDHVRPGYIGIGGLPYVSGFVDAVRADRDDVLVLDAGDALEKGDLLAYRTKGRSTYEAMARVGYDAITIGNHDLDFGIEHLRDIEEGVLEQQFVLLNLIEPSGEPIFTPSRVVDVDGVRVGIIGMISPRDAAFGGVDLADSGEMLAEESERLAQESDIIVALAHEGSRYVSEWARMAPSVDIFVAGHHHETLLEPMSVEGSDAIIVSAGSDAHWVGHLEVELNPETGEIVGYEGGLNLMRHDTVPVDADMVSWLESYEAEWAPEASAAVTRLEEPLGWFAVSRLAAEAIRLHADADVGFYHPAQIVRNGLPAGSIDLNAIFRISSERADSVVRLNMTGREISEYMTALAMSDWGQTQWSGFEVSVRQTGRNWVFNGVTVERAQYANDLDPDRFYSVVMPEREFDRYLTDIFQPAYVRARPLENEGDDMEVVDVDRQGRHFPHEVLEFPAYQAVRAHLEALGRSEVSVERHLATLVAEQGDADPNEEQFEQQLVLPLTPEHYLELEQRTDGLQVTANQR